MSRGRLRRHGSSRRRRDPTPRNRISDAGIAEEVSRFGGAVQRIFRTDRVGQESGPVPGSAQAELFESGTDGADGSPNVPDAAGRNAGGISRNSGTKPDSARLESGGEFSGAARNAIK